MKHTLPAPHSSSRPPRPDSHARHGAVDIPAFIVSALSRLFRSALQSFRAFRGSASVHGAAGIPAFIVYRLSFIVSALSLSSALAAPPSPSTPPSDPSRLFADASRAYDENRLGDSVDGFSALLDRGCDSPAVLFNLGNAAFRGGDLPLAIRSYRRAQLLAPRDPDIRANLSFAARSAGILLPEPPAPLAFLLSLSRAEALWTALASFWILCILAAAALWWPRVRPFLRIPAALLALLLLLAAASLAARTAQNRRPECVLLAETSLLAAPLDSSTPLLSLPAGSIVRVIDSRDAWSQVLHPAPDAPPAWLPSAALAPVLP